MAMTPDRVIAMAFEAAGDPGRMPPLLHALCEFLGARAANLNFVDDTCRTATIGAAVGIPNGALEAYRDRFWALDEWRRGAARRGMPAGRVVDGREFVSERALLASPFYHEHLRELDLFYWCGIRIVLGTRGHLVLSVQRARSQGSFGDEVRSSFERISSPVARAVSLTARMCDLENARTSNAAVLAHLDLGVIALGRLGKVLDANDAACALVREFEAARRGREQTNAARLQGFVNRVTAQIALRDAAAGEAALVQARSITLRCEVIDVHGVGLSLTGVAAERLVLIRRHRLRSLPDAATLGRQYGLTPAEARLVACLLDGCTLHEAAGDLRVTYGTAQQYLKRVFDKTGARRQTELVRRIFADALRNGFSCPDA